MPHLRLRTSDQTEHEIDAAPGNSVMQVAVDHGGTGIIGQCGGALACASCHVYVDEEWTEAVGGPGELEREMLSGALSPMRETSRLSCQITMTDELDGLSVEVAPEQL